MKHKSKNKYMAHNSEKNYEKNWNYYKKEKITRKKALKSRLGPLWKISRDTNITSMHPFTR